LGIEEFKEFVKNTKSWPSKLGAVNLKDQHLISLRDFLLNSTAFIQSTHPGHLVQRAWHVLNDNYALPRCVQCGNQHSNWNRAKKNYSDYCGIECARKSQLSKERRKATNLERYGVEAPLQNKEIIEKLYSTNIEKYGHAFSLNNPEVRQKANQTMLEKYGTTDI